MLLTGCATSLQDSSPVDTGAAAEGCADNAWMDVSLGYYRACGVHADGCVECWGDVNADAVNDTAWTNYGLLDPPSVPARSVSVETSTIDDGEPSACVVDADGEVVCWGRPLLTSLPGQSGIARVQAQGRTEVVLQTTTGAVGRYVWNRDTYMTDVVDLGQADAGKVWAGVAGTCVIQEHQLRCTSVYPEESFQLEGVLSAGVGYYGLCWSDLSGALQCRVFGATSADEADVPPKGSFRAPCVGTLASCAIDEGDRAVCFGSTSSPTGPHWWTSPGDVPLEDLRCGPGGACGITADGKLHCFGDDSSVNRPPGSFVVP